jgi:predicted CoA-binding protein
MPPQCGTRARILPSLSADLQKRFELLHRLRRTLVAAMTRRNPVELPSVQDLLRIYEQTSSIAVVGASANEEKDANSIPRYLQSQGYRIIPVNPRGGEILGEPVYRSLGEVAVPFDVVDVFRPSEEAEEVARQAVATSTKVLWFQPGTDSKRAVKLARDAGLTVVAGLCMGATHGHLGLGRGPD